MMGCPDSSVTVPEREFWAIILREREKAMVKISKYLWFIIFVGNGFGCESWLQR
jgi:hypothetical protein